MPAKFDFISNATRNVDKEDHKKGFPVYWSHWDCFCWHFGSVIASCETHRSYILHFATIFDRTYLIYFVLLKRSKSKDMPELPHVYAGLSKLFRKLGMLLHPTVCGPYLLEIADPLGRLVVEWDSSWKLYPPWRQERHQEFVQRKHFHLRAEGWKLLLIPLESYTALPEDEKLNFLDGFCKEHDLTHLHVGKMPEAAETKGEWQSSAKMVSWEGITKEASTKHLLNP